MNTFILVTTSLKSLQSHIIRSFLTVLGIMIGIAAIIITFSIGRGAQERVKEQVMAMGENSIYIIPLNIAQRGAQKTTELTSRDVKAIIGQCPEEIKELSRQHIRESQQVEYEDSSWRENISGVDPNRLIISNYKLQSGIFINEYHERNKIPVAVLAQTTAQRLFATQDPIGKTIKINRYPFRVIGVVGHVPHYFGPRDPNQQVYIPFSVSRKLFRNSQESDNNIGYIAIKYSKDNLGKSPTEKIRKILRFTHNISPDAADDFTIFDQESVGKAADRASAIIKLFGLIAASISLCVGGIGVMNIMLVSVQERTREIGIRLAIGATPTLIQTQFLIEAVTLCLFGGILGIFLGLAGFYAISSFTLLPGIIELLPLIASLCITLLVGIFFGFYPARIASRKRPIDALR